MSSARGVDWYHFRPLKIRPKCRKLQFPSFYVVKIVFRLNGAPPGQSGGVNQVWLDRSGRDLATGMLGEYLGGGSVGQNWESLNSLCHGYCWKTSVIGVWAAWLAPGCSVDPESAITLVFQ